MKTEAVIDHIVGWLDDYRRRSGMEGFVVGVSGGIDSAVTSTLCARTGLPVRALNMPILQDPQQKTLADRHIDWLTVNYPAVTGQTIDLSGALVAVREALPAAVQDDLTLANTRSRLRMVTLYAVAGHYRLLVAGTGNKVEDFGVGFFTKYGDGGVDIAPIADLVKSEVYALGEALGVIGEIRAAAPTDGLWADNRTDESQLGATYRELEWAMAFAADPKEEEGLPGRQRHVLEIYRKFHGANRHKIEPIPVCRIPEALRQS